MHQIHTARHACIALASMPLMLALASPAAAGCAEDITRAQLALQAAKPADGTKVEERIAAALERARQRDRSGCENSIGEALAMLGLTPTPALVLSTPVADDPSVPATADPVAPAAQQPAASPDPRRQGEQAAAPGAVPPAASSPTAQSAPSAPRPGAATSAPVGAPAADQPSRYTSSATANAPDAGAGAAQEADGGNPFLIVSQHLIGLPVLDRDNAGHTVGRVANLVIDRQTGETLYVVLEWGGFLGWNRNRVIVPFGLLAFSGKWDRPTLRVPAFKIENAPQIRELDLEEVLKDPDWRRGIVQYFGTTLAGDAAPPEANAGEPAAPAAAPATAPATAPASPSPTNSGAGGPSSEPKAQPGEGASGPTTQTSAAAPPAPAGGAGANDPNHGKQLAQRACAACHTFDQGGETRVGPNLFGLAGRGIASVEGYNYSAALKGHKGQWDAGSLDAFLKAPRGFAPGTYMTFPGIRSDKDRADVVAFLQSLQAGGSR